MWEAGWRDSVWADMDRPWDLIVIGGGITGAGIFREGVRVGLRVLLLEGGDFACGTSSRSSKLVHGGLRYLKNGQIKTTIASVRERERLLQEGKGLINPLGFLYASYATDNMPLWVLGLGLTIYDLLGLHWGHKRYGPAGLNKLAPGLNLNGLTGGYRYFDAQTDDARLVLRVIREGVRDIYRGDYGRALNYARVESLLKRKNGQVCGVVVRDVSGVCGGRTAEVQATVVINATGAAADQVRAEIGGRPRLRCLRGSHLVFAENRLPLLRAITFAHPTDDRPVFAIPWEGVTLFGTTDVDHAPSMEVEPSISGSELEYLLTATRHAFPDFEIEQTDVQATLSGIRTVIDTGKADPSKESREHIMWDENGLLTVAGGKLTTFRIMALAALNAVRSQWPTQPRFRGRRVFDTVAALSELTRLEPWQRLRLTGRYGNDAPRARGGSETWRINPNRREFRGQIALGRA